MNTPTIPEDHLRAAAWSLKSRASKVKLPPIAAKIAPATTSPKGISRSHHAIVPTYRSYRDRNSNPFARNIEFLLEAPIGALEAK
jgi:hypothetical protein